MKNTKENPFKMLETNEEVPNSVKDKVMNDVRLAYLLGDLAELFTVRMGMTISGMFDDHVSNEEDLPGNDIKKKP